MVIYKYSLSPEAYQYLEMPSIQRILSVQNQGGNICVWAIVDREAPVRRYRFAIYGTGNSINLAYSQEFIGTVQIDNFVWHVFFLGEV